MPLFQQQRFCNQKQLKEYKQSKSKMFMSRIMHSRAQFTLFDALYYTLGKLITSIAVVVDIVLTCKFDIMACAPALPSVYSTFHCLESRGNVYQDIRPSQQPSLPPP